MMMIWFDIVFSVLFRRRYFFDDVNKNYRKENVHGVHLCLVNLRLSKLLTLDAFFSVNRHPIIQTLTLTMEPKLYFKGARDRCPSIATVLALELQIDGSCHSALFGSQIFILFKLEIVFVVSIESSELSVQLISAVFQS